MQGLTSRGAVQLLSSDSAVLDLEENRKDLPCTVTSVKPMLGFDLRFHSGYEITVPLHELSGDGNLLTIIFRVSTSDKDSPVYFSQKYNVPNLDADANDIPIETIEIAHEGLERIP